MNTAALAALNVVVALAVPALAPAALGHSPPSAPRHHHALPRPAQRNASGETVVSVAPVVAIAPGWTPLQGSFGNPFATPPRPLEWPKIAPYPPGQGDADGLSTNIDDCNKGCIGGQPD